MTLFILPPYFLKESDDLTPYARVGLVLRISFILAQARVMGANFITMLFKELAYIGTLRYPVILLFPHSPRYTMQLPLYPDHTLPHTYLHATNGETKISCFFISSAYLNPTYTSGRRNVADDPTREGGH